MTDKNKQTKGKNGNAGTWTGTGFQPAKAKTPKKPITLLDILTGKR